MERGSGRDRRGGTRGRERGGSKALHSYNTSRGSGHVSMVRPQLCIKSFPVTLDYRSTDFHGLVSDT